jgi:4-hydroxythreonine-4-phosphate dehydrogenase
MRTRRSASEGPVGSASHSSPLALTMGDPAGIGLDITLAAWSTRHFEPLPAFVLFADPETTLARARQLGLSVEVAVLSGIDSGLIDFGNDRLPVLPVPLMSPAVAGHGDPANAAAVVGAIELAVAETVAGRTAAVVTNPISKATLYSSGFAYPGHTEFLGVLADRHFPGGEWTPVMLLASDELRVVPLTVHIPLSRVPSEITTDRIVEVCRVTARDLAHRFGLSKPRIAVAGLNPHAGEGGSIGREEIDSIAPAITRLRSEGLDVNGPYSADTLFHPAARRRYDVAVCMYHDQALIPIKTLAFDTGVNVTLGLPFVRTSPDHGTAFDIAGTGRASPTSLVAALRLADRMASARGVEQA